MVFLFHHHLSGWRSCEKVLDDFYRQYIFPIHSSESHRGFKRGRKLFQLIPVETESAKAFSSLWEPSPWLWINHLNLMFQPFHGCHPAWSLFEVVVVVSISTDIKNMHWTIQFDCLYIPSWRISPKSSCFCKLAVKCLREHGERPCRCLAFAVPQWQTETGGAWSNALSHLYFLLFLFSHFSNLLSPSFAGSWANPEVSGFSLNLHFTLNGLSFHTT